MMSDRPPPDPAKLLEQWRSWGRGESTAGRAMSDLKTGRLPEILEALPEPRPDLDEPWDRWERGSAGPAEVLGALSEAGLAALLEQLVEERQAAS